MVNIVTLNLANEPDYRVENVLSERKYGKSCFVNIVMLSLANEPDYGEGIYSTDVTIENLASEI